MPLGVGGRGTWEGEWGRAEGQWAIRHLCKAHLREYMMWGDGKAVLDINNSDQSLSDAFFSSLLFSSLCLDLTYLLERST